MAPEILRNWKVTAKKIPPEEGSVYTPPSDVYSLTVVLWELLTTQQPYTQAIHVWESDNGKTLPRLRLEDMIMNDGFRPYDPNGTIQDGKGGIVDPVLQAIVERGWHPESEQRWTAAEIQEFLETAVDAHNSRGSDSESVISELSVTADDSDRETVRTLSWGITFGASEASHQRSQRASGLQSQRTTRRTSLQSQRTASQNSSQQSQHPSSLEEPLLGGD